MSTRSTLRAADAVLTRLSLLFFVCTLCVSDSLPVSAQSKVRTDKSNGPVVARWQGPEGSCLTRVETHAGSSPGQGQELVTSRSATQPTGLIADRLNRKQLRIWRAMEQIALARNGSGQPLRPVLHELYNWAETCNMPIYIEMPKAEGRWAYLAGECLFEEQPEPVRSRVATVTIRLYTTVIDRVPSGGRSPSERGFVPFKGLTRKERYCETLAHELVHVRQSVTDLEFFKLTHRLRGLNDQVLRLQTLRLDAANRQSVTKEMQAIAAEINVLWASIEVPAIAVEQKIWQELSGR